MIDAMSEEIERENHDKFHVLRWNMILLIRLEEV